MLSMDVIEYPSYPFSDPASSAPLNSRALLQLLAAFSASAIGIITGISSSVSSSPSDEGELASLFPSVAGVGTLNDRLRILEPCT